MNLKKFVWGLIVLGGLGAAADDGCSTGVTLSRLHLFRNLPLTKTESLAAFSDSAFAERVAGAVLRGEWDSDFLSPSFARSEDVLRAALRLVNEGRLKMTSVEYLILRWQWWRDYGHFAVGKMRSRPVLEADGSLSSEFAALYRRAADTDVVLLDEAGLLRLQTELQKIPRDEIYFSELTTRMTSATLEGKELHRMIRIFLDFGQLDWIFREGPAGHTRIFIPSVPLLNAILRARFPDNAVQLWAELGPAKWEDIASDTDHDARAYGMGFPGIRLPNKADEIGVNDSGFSVHDVFHAIQLSKIDKRYRRLVARLYRQRISSAKAMQSLQDLMTDGIPRGGVLLVEDDFDPLKWLSEDLGAEYTSVLGVLERDYRHNKTWYQQNDITLAF